jgi:hypothetical protein
MPKGYNKNKNRTVDVCSNPMCAKLGIEQSIEEFSWLNKVKGYRQSWCKECLTAYNKSPKGKANFTRYSKSLKGKACHATHEKTPKRRAYVTVYRKIHSKTPKGKMQQKVYKTSPKGKATRIARERVRLSTDIQFKIKKSLRTRLGKAIKNGQKSGSAVKDLGCTIPEFKHYFESKFYPNPVTGEMMTWESWGWGLDKWQMDHIQPLTSFDLSNREEFLKAFHYTNLQPLWFKDHIKKSAQDIKSWKAWEA